MNVTRLSLCRGHFHVGIKGTFSRGLNTGKFLAFAFVFLLDSAGRSWHRINFWKILQEGRGRTVPCPREVFWDGSESEEQEAKRILVIIG